ncbi:hypothetical protein ASE70_10805 [Sphingomonas sp. Leaf22]|uniref:hypothetical protein n=1 Tax=Sphingomonas sp. Leaf22 TaxID=1735687 RepID=UPI0006FFF2E6|nr:hypothetical protein [Sphingomonas sp. Leaf22]KQM75846.1 hypothetical protein ASE70_10805 [Sphingomonas sp. Leaf22]
MLAPIGLVAIVALLAAMLSGRIAPLVATVTGMPIVAVPCFKVRTGAALGPISAALGSARRCALGSGVTRSLTLDAVGTVPGGSMPALEAPA